MHASDYYATIQINATDCAGEGSEHKMNIANKKILYIFGATAAIAMACVSYFFEFTITSEWADLLYLLAGLLLTTALIWSIRIYTLNLTIAIHLATQQENLGKVETLFNQGAEVNYRSNNGNTPLMYAVAKDNIPMAKLLLNQGAEVNQDNNGWTPLMMAVEKDNIQMAELLLNKGANTGKDGLTPLRMAIINRNTQMVRKLIVTPEIVI